MTKIALLRDEPFDPASHTFIFTHIPKCGGNSLRRMFQSAFGERYQISYRPYNPTLPNAFAGGGHHNFGDDPLHSRGNLVYFTVLRDPLSYTVSFYRFVKDQSNHWVRRFYPGIENRSLIDFAKTLYEGHTKSRYRNFFCWKLCQEARDYDEAQTLISSRYSMVGVLEHPSMHMAWLRRTFPNHTFIELHSNKSRSERPAIDPATRAYIESQNEMDFTLYEAVLNGARARQPLPV